MENSNEQVTENGKGKGARDSKGREDGTELTDPEIPETGFKHFHTMGTGHNHQSLPLQWPRGQAVGLYVEHGGKLVMSSQVKQNKAFLEGD